MLGSIGGQEFLLIAVLALLLFGPRKLPQIGRSVGRALAEFRGATHEFKSSLEREVEMETLKDAKNGIESVRRDIADAVRETTRPAPADRPVRAVGDEDENEAARRPPDPVDGEKPPQS